MSEFIPAAIQIMARQWGCSESEAHQRLLKTLNRDPKAPPSYVDCVRSAISLFTALDHIDHLPAGNKQDFAFKTVRRRVDAFEDALEPMFKRSVISTALAWMNDAATRSVRVI